MKKDFGTIHVILYLFFPNYFKNESLLFHKTRIEIGKEIQILMAYTCEDFKNLQLLHL
jgi:hypothetical protein